MSTRHDDDKPWTPLPEFAAAAVEAGQMARVEGLSVKKQPSKQRHATVYDTKKDGCVTAEHWMWSVSRKCCKDEAVGAGTPLVCLYLLGWIFGKHPCGMCLAVFPLAFCWGRFLKLSLENSNDAKNSNDAHNNFAEMWIALAAVFCLSACLFAARVFKRTPRGVPRTAGFWGAILIETFLANSLTIVAHGFGFAARIRLGVEGAPLIFLGVSAFASPFGIWYAVQNKVLDRQHAFVRERNLAKGDGFDAPLQSGRRGGAPPEAEKFAACAVVDEVVASSRDVRMLGLSRAELNRLAAYLAGTPQAELILFYTKRAETACKGFERQDRFHAAYTHALEDDRGGALRAWIEQWLAEVSSTGDCQPWTSVRKLADAATPPAGCPFTCCPSNDPKPSNEPKERIWWLCGAIARVLDEADSRSHGADVVDGNYQWYALMASALSVNENPTAAILAMKKDKGQAAAGMLKHMQAGCKKVLGRVDPARDFSVGRGLVFTDAAVLEADSDGGDIAPPVITLSPAGVWQAENSRGAVMLGEDAFNSFWRAQQGNGELTSSEKTGVRRNSVVWSQNMEVYVDFTHVFAFMGLGGTALVNVRAAATRGWVMHVVWCVCVVLVQCFFPRLLLPLAALATAFLQVGVADQCAHVVYVAKHLWAFAPLSMSDADISFTAWIGFVLLVGVVNYGSAYAGLMYTTPFEKAAFWLLLLGSVAPGLRLFVLRGAGGDGIESGGGGGGGGDGGAVVRYVGKNKGKMSLGRDMLLDNDPAGGGSGDETSSMSSDSSDNSA